MNSPSRLYGHALHLLLAWQCAGCSFVLGWLILGIQAIRLDQAASGARPA